MSTNVLLYEFYCILFLLLRVCSLPGAASLAPEVKGDAATEKRNAKGKATFIATIFLLCLLFPFCLRRSPDHGTVDVIVVVVLIGGTTLIFDFFQDTEIFIK